MTSLPALHAARGRACLPRWSAGRATDGRRRWPIACVEFGLPGLRRLAGPGIDQVEGIGAERCRARAPIAVQRLRRRLCSRPRKLQIRVVQRLHAERDAVDAGRAVAAEALGLDAGRVGLERDLDAVGRPSSASPIASSMAPTVAGSISEGVPPPRKIAVTVRGPVRAPRIVRDLAAEGGGEARLVDAAGGGHGC